MATALGICNSHSGLYADRLVFIWQAQGGAALSEHAKLVLVGTMVTWVPYMLAVIVPAPRVSAGKAIGIGRAVFFVLATIFL